MVQKGENQLIKNAQEIRLLMLKALRPKESHHIGCSFSIVDIATYLYFQELKVNSQDPEDPQRDIFILSKGHAALTVYATLYKKGFINKNMFFSYDQDAGKLPEHISSNVPGVELSTGSLGHGLPVGIGFAFGFKNDKKSNRVFVLLSDGELDEGSNWEGFMFAGHHRLDNIVCIVDKNGYQGYAATKNVINLDPIAPKITGFGWNVYETDGHDFDKLKKTFSIMKKNKNHQPNMIIANTIKGKGVPYFEGKFESHYQSIDKETKQKIIKEFIKL